MKARWLVLVAALAADQAGSASGCNWNNPGADPLRIPSHQAIEVYTDIAPAQRKVLARKIAALEYDDFVQITRSGIQGAHTYRPEIIDMLYGAGKPCRGISERSGWEPDHVEYAFVYVVKGGPDIMVATSCRNPARVRRAPAPKAADKPSQPGGGMSPSEPITFGGGGGLTIPPQLLFRLPPLPDPLPPTVALDVEPPPAMTEIVETQRSGPVVPFGAPVIFSAGGGGVVFVPVEAPVPTPVPEPERPVAVIPEPATWVLWLGGLIALGVWRKRAERQADKAVGQ